MRWMLLLSISAGLLATNAATPAKQPAEKPRPSASPAEKPVRAPLLRAQVEFSSLAEVKIANQKLAEAHDALRFAAYESAGRVIAYRVVADDLRPGSAASEALQGYVMQAIAQEESSRGRTNPQVAEVKFIEAGSEFWILKSSGDSIAYDVTFMSAEGGGLNIGVVLASAFLR